MDEELMTRLRRAVSRISRQLNDSASDEGLTPSEATILGVVARSGPVSLPELARGEGLNPTMLSRIVGKMDRAGLITRLRDPSDRRSAQVSVTEHGRKVEARIRAGRAAAVARTVQALSDEQQRELTQAVPALEAFAEHLRQSKL
ncbi:MarR family winged helix-turn-helix transcriptional regulator [Streptomyces hyderabadensis]|uniref:MarR family transcriptional regulator n=2 Tax=Streptomyces hyderabadensis TaxID=598549 RepID=A0ABP9IPE6_9ACTN